MALLLFSMNYPQLPKLVQKLNCRGVSSVPEMTLHIFIFLTSILMWEIVLLPVSSDVNRVLGRKPPNNSPQKYPPYFWSKCYIIVCIILLRSLSYHLILVSSRPHCLESFNMLIL